MNLKLKNLIELAPVIKRVNSYELTAEKSLAIFKLKKFSSEKVDELIELEKSIMEEIGIETTDFSEHGSYIGKDVEKINRFVELKNIELNKEIELDFNPLTYEDWFVLCKNDKDLGKYDLLLEGILFTI